jgi:hypothetical protein
LHEWGIAHATVGGAATVATVARVAAVETPAIAAAAVETAWEEILTVQTGHFAPVVRRYQTIVARAYREVACVIGNPYECALCGVDHQPHTHHATVVLALRTWSRVSEAKRGHPAAIFSSPAPLTAGEVEPGDVPATRANDRFHTNIYQLLAIIEIGARADRVEL